MKLPAVWLIFAASFLVILLRKIPEGVDIKRKPSYSTNLMGYD